MQTTTPSDQSEQTSTPRGSRRTVITLAVSASIIVVLVVAVVALRATRAGVLPNVLLAGEQVGGMDREQLEQTVERLRDGRTDDMLTAELDDRARSASAATIGYGVDVDATVERVWRRGRQANLVTALTDHARATFGEIAVEAVTFIDDTKLDRWVSTTTAALEQPPTEGDVSFDGTDVARTDPQPGRRPSATTLRAGTVAALDEQGPATVAFETEDVEPSTTTADVDELERLARRVVSAPVELTRGDEALRIDPDTLAGLFVTVQRRGGDGDVALDVAVSRSAVAEVFDGEVRERFEADPRDATIELTNGGPKVRDGRDGFTIDLDAARTQIDDLARVAPTDDGARTAKLEGTVVEPGRTTEQARDLQITQKVSSFTTNHACCQGRVGLDLGLR